MADQNPQLVDINQFIGVWDNVFDENSANGQ